MASIKAVELAEVTGWAVMVQDAAKAKAEALASVKAVELAEVTGWAVPVQDAAEAKAEATLVTLLGGIKEDAADKNTYIDIRFTHFAARWNYPSCCRVC